jgi:SAM-dependent methyltransferase
VTQADPDRHARRLAARSLATGDPTGWFEQLYAEAESGQAAVPWFRGAPRPTLVAWAEQHSIPSEGRRALVVGCGLGDDAEYVAGLGFATVAFDISASAIRAARRRFPGSGVAYTVADLLDPPRAWHEAFDLVVECYNVQALPKAVQPAAIVQVGRMVAPGGDLLVIGFVADEDGGGPGDQGGGDQGGGDQGPPWPLTRAEVESFATGGLRATLIDEVTDPADPTVRRWVAEFTRPSSNVDGTAR